MFSVDRQGVNGDDDFYFVFYFSIFYLFFDIRNYELDRQGVNDDDDCLLLFCLKAF